MYQSAFNARLRPLLDTISGVLAVVQVNNAGKMKLVQLNMARVPPQAQPIMTLFNGQILTALQALSFPMPGKVEYGQTWENTTNLFVPTSSRTQGGLFKMKFKYLGVRERAGRREAPIEIGGSLAADPNAKGVESTDTKAQPAQPSDPDKGKDTPDPSANRYQAPAEVASGARRKGLYGDAHGYAIVDLQDGFVAEVQLYIDMDVEILVKDPGSKQDLPVTAGGTMEWTRHVPPASDSTQQSRGPRSEPGAAPLSGPRMADDLIHCPACNFDVGCRRKRMAHLSNARGVIRDSRLQRRWCGPPPTDRRRGGSMMPVRRSLSRPRTRPTAGGPRSGLFSGSRDLPANDCAARPLGLWANARYHDPN